MSRTIGKQYVPAWRHERLREKSARLVARVREISNELRSAKRRMEAEVQRIRELAAERQARVTVLEEEIDLLRRRVVTLKLANSRQAEVLRERGAA